MVLEAAQAENDACESQEPNLAAAAAQSERTEHEEPDVPLEEELNTRRRHVTGDSGIEMCVCQLDTDECSGMEEDEGRMCHVPGGSCCLETQAPRPKEISRSPTSNGDHVV